MATIAIKPPPSHFRDFSIGVANIGIKLGKGSFGVVSKCEYRGDTYAIKTIRSGLEEDQKRGALVALRKEINAFTALQPHGNGHGHRVSRLLRSRRVPQNVRRESGR